MQNYGITFHFIELFADSLSAALDLNIKVIKDGTFVNDLTRRRLVDMTFTLDGIAPNNSQVGIIRLIKANQKYILRKHLPIISANFYLFIFIYCQLQSLP